MTRENRLPSILSATSIVCLTLAFTTTFATVPAAADGPKDKQSQAVSTPFPTAAEEYRIGPGDDLAISFPYNAELNHDGPVGPDGRFNLPLVGNLPLGGQTVTEAAELIRRTLRESGIVENAYPSITVRKYGVSVFVGGEVRTPGTVPLTAGMDALQAVIVAGGMLDTAKTKRVAIIRRAANNTASVIYLDLNGYRKGKPNATTAMLEPRDVIFVPRSSIAEVDRWVDQYINKTIPFQRALSYNFGNYGTTVTK